MNSVQIVEDEKHLADGLRYNLNAEGYEVDTVGTGEEALALLADRRKSYDVLVLDVMLPGIDGFSLASRLRSEGQFVPILMLTARGRSEDVLRGFEAGADDYLPKRLSSGFCWRASMRCCAAANGCTRIAAARRMMVLRVRRRLSLMERRSISKRSSCGQANRS